MNTEKSDEAIPFITYKEKEGFRLNPEAEQFLRQLDPTRKVAVISIVGKYRTGKSFFVNRVLLNRAGRKAGFSVGPTINPCTKGLWLWKECLYSEELQEEVDVILIDTEGFGGMDENQNHDSRIFLFSLLLSSYFIYNSQGTIDETALNNISLIINLSKDIKLSDSSSTEQQDPADYFPSFLWVLRDFALQMLDTQKQVITPKDYLEKALENQKGVSDVIESKNKIRRQLKHFFKDRDCSTLIRPTEAESDLQRLNEMKDEELRPEFVQQTLQLRKRIFKRLKPKVVNGKTLNGYQLADICKAYIQAINKGGMPNIENAWTYMCKNESIRVIEESLNSVQADLDQYLKCETNEPLNAKQLHDLKLKMKDDLVKSFKKKSIASEEELKEFYDQLDKEFADKFKDFKKKNKENLQGRFQEICMDKIKQFDRKLDNEEYGNYLDFEKEFSEFKQEFEKGVGRSEESDEYFKKVSEQIYKKAAEKVSRRQQRELEKDKRVMEQRFQLAEIELTKNKGFHEEEKKQLQQRIADLERERAQLLANDLYSKEFANRLTQDKDRLQQQLDAVNAKLSAAQEKAASTITVSLEKFNKDIDNANAQTRELEKQQALLSQELSFSQRENQSLQAKLAKAESTIAAHNAEQIQANSQIIQLKHAIETLDRQKQHTIESMKQEFSKQLTETKAETEATKSALESHTEVLKENAFLNSQLAFLKNQLDENKRLHDALLLALQQGMQKEEDENTGELLETNKNLSAAMDKLEQRCGMLDDKVNGLKEFKRMVKNSNSMQCVNCSKFIATRIFLQHLNSCAPSSYPNSSTLIPSGIMQPQQQQLHHTSSASIISSSITGGKAVGQVPTEAQPIVLMISQTIVRESPDTKKPYTEYVIQVQLLNHQRWEVPRKYKNFCELHHALTTQFPVMKFPESSLAIINSATETGAPNQKRPSLIEERRRALQQYIKDLSRIEPIRNSRAFRNFLEVDTHLAATSSGQTNYRNQMSSSQIGSSTLIGTNSNSNSNLSNIGSARLIEKENNTNNLNSFQSPYLTQQIQSLNGGASGADFNSNKPVNSSISFVQAWQNKENSKFNLSRSKSMSQQQQQQQQGEMVEFGGQDGQAEEQGNVNGFDTHSTNNGMNEIEDQFAQSYFPTSTEQPAQFYGGNTVTPNKVSQRQLSQAFSSTQNHYANPNTSTGQTKSMSMTSAGLQLASKAPTYSYNFQKQQSQKSPNIGQQQQQQHQMQDQQQQQFFADRRQQGYGSSQEQPSHNINIYQQKQFFNSNN